MTVPASATVSPHQASFLSFSWRNTRASNPVHIGTVAMINAVLPEVVKSTPNRNSTW